MTRFRDHLPQPASRALGLLLVLVLAARTQAAEPADAVVDHYLAAMRTWDTTAMAENMHPNAHQRFKQLVRPLVVDEPAAAGMFGVGTLREFDALPANQVMGRMLRNLGEMSPQFKSMIAGGHYMRIGSVAEGADTMHVVYRAEVGMDSLKVSKMQVITCVRAGEAWRISLPLEVETAARQLGQSGKR